MPAPSTTVVPLIGGPRTRCLTILAWTALLVPVIGWGDYVTGADVAFTLLYLAPVAVASWYCGSRAGALISALCTGTWLWADHASRTVHLHPVVLAWNCAVEAGIFIAFAFVLARLREQLVVEQHLAATDPLTGLANRRAFFATAHAELERSRRLEQPLTLAYFDLDGFKALNDRHGHAAGDAILNAVATHLRAATRAFDLPVRMGGDEFAVLFPGLDAQAAPEMLERLNRELVEALSQRWQGSLSCGAVTFLSAPASVAEMLAQADRLMYEVKRAGKGSLRHEVRP